MSQNSHEKELELAGRRINELETQLEEAREREEALNNTARLYRTTIDGLEDMIHVIDSDYKFILTNSVFKRWCKKFEQNTNVKGLTVFEAFPFLPESVREEYKRAFEKGKTIFTEESNVIDDTEVHTESLKIPIVEKDRVCKVITIVRDISRRKTAEHGKTQLEAQLRQAQKLEAIGILAGGVAHEINNPINIIMNFGQLILDSTEKESQVAKDANEIVNESLRIAEIVKKLLAFSRQTDETFNPVQIIDIVQSTMTLTNKLLSKDQIAIDIEIPGDLPVIMVREQQIMQVLMNLITNARDALNERYPEYDADKTILISCKTFTKDQNLWLRTTVKDHGAGVPSEFMECIFDPFFTTKPKHLGTGLGLSVSYGIIKDHRGELRVESEDGKGTEFHLDLPTTQEG